jgi:hypothetical protein
MKYLSRDDNFSAKKIENFEFEARRMMREVSKKDRPPHEYIPGHLKLELDLPGDLEEHSINFNEVIKKDCLKKRKTPFWSGQDVLDIGLNNELSYWIIGNINAVRVWPKGIIG